MRAWQPVGMDTHTDTLQIHGVEIRHHFADHVYAKEAIIPAGLVLAQHIHPTHDHLSILASGRALVTSDGVAETLEGPCCITIKRGVPHSVQSLTGVVWFCIHATDDTDPATVDTSILVGGNG